MDRYHPRVHTMGTGSAGSGHLPCKQDISWIRVPGSPLFFVYYSMKTYFISRFKNVLTGELSASNRRKNGFSKAIVASPASVSFDTTGLFDEAGQSLGDIYTTSITCSDTVQGRTFNVQSGYILVKDNWGDTFTISELVENMNINLAHVGRFEAQGTNIVLVNSYLKDPSSLSVSIIFD